MSYLNKLGGQFNPKFELLPTSNNKWYWRFKAINGEILCHSETYVSKQGAENGIDSLVQNIKNHF